MTWVKKVSTKNSIQYEYKEKKDNRIRIKSTLVAIRYPIKIKKAVLTDKLKNFGHRVSKLIEKETGKYTKFEIFYLPFYKGSSRKVIGFVNTRTDAQKKLIKLKSKYREG